MSWFYYWLKNKEKGQPLIKEKAAQNIRYGSAPAIMI